MRQDPIALSPGAATTAFIIVGVLIGIGIGGTVLTLRAAGAAIAPSTGRAAEARPGNSEHDVAADGPPSREASADHRSLGEGGQVGPATPREFGGLLHTLIERDDSAADQRRRDEQRLSEYGWADRSRGTVRIPIERAMAIVAAEGR